MNYFPLQELSPFKDLFICRGPSSDMSEDQENNGICGSGMYNAQERPGYVSRPFLLVYVRVGFLGPP